MTGAVQTPLTDLLRAVPADARLLIAESPLMSRSIPVGRLCAEAVAEIERLRADAERYRWLRARSRSDWADAGVDPSWHGVNPAELDCAVDAARGEPPVWP